MSQQLPFPAALYPGLNGRGEMLPPPLAAPLSMIDSDAVLGARLCLLPWLPIRARTPAGYQEDLRLSLGPSFVPIF